MKITVPNGRAFADHKDKMILDRRALNHILYGNTMDLANPNYHIDRGAVDVMGNLLVVFDVFEHLRNLYKERGDVIEVVEGGCGIGNTLADLKRGVTFAELPQNGTPSVTIPSDTYRWRNGLVGRHFEGLAGKIRTTGITLSQDHANIAALVEEPYRIDEMVIGPVGHYKPGRKYDFFLDFYGAGFYSFNDALPAYAAMVKPGGFGLFRTNDFTNCDLTMRRNFIGEVGFDIMDEKGTFCVTDMVLKRRQANLY